MNPSEHPLTAERLTLHRDSHTVLRDISFSLPPVGITGLLGRNGAGKSSLLNTLAGALFPTTGEVRLGPRLSPTLTPRTWRNLVAFLPDTPTLTTQRSPVQLMRDQAPLFGLDPSHANRRASHLIDLLELTQARDTPCARLSLGFQKRVALATILLPQPHLILLDEPSAGLDPEQIVTLRRLLSSLADDHKIVMSSHILQEVSSLCDDLLVLHQGALVVDTRAAGQDRWRDLTRGELYRLEFPPHQRARALTLLARHPLVSRARRDESSLTLVHVLLSTPPTEAHTTTHLSTLLSTLLSHGLTPVSWTRPSPLMDLEARFLDWTS